MRESNTKTSLDGPAAAHILDLRSRVEHSIDQAMVELRENVGRGPVSEELSKDLDGACRGGKRVRSLLFVLAYQGYGGDPHEALWRGAAAIEMLQSFALIHDDILDGSLRRRGRNSMPVSMRRHLAAPEDGEASGAHLAMLAGDILFAFAVDSFLSMALRPTDVIRAMRIITSAAVLTGGGAATELVYRMGKRVLSESELLDLYDAKTGVYSFACPLQAGAILAGASSAQQALLHAFGTHLGRAYQVGDDLHDLDALMSGREAGPVVSREAWLWFPVQAALRRLSKEECGVLQDGLTTMGTPSADPGRVMSLLRKGRAFAETHACLRSAYDHAMRLAEGLDMDDTAMQSLEALCGQFVDHDT